MSKVTGAVSVLVLAVAGIAGAQTVVNADITANTTWNLAGSPYVLQKPIFVKNGATLTILPGVIVRGQPRTAAVQEGSTAGTPGALIVTQTGRIVANASPSNPIVFTTAAVDNNNDGVADDADANGFIDPWVPGGVFLDDAPRTEPLAPLAKNGTESNVALWGGVVILGNAPTNMANECGEGYGKCTVEGLTIPGFPPADATYGGVLPHDNSGILRYVSIRHAGDEIGAGNELNGLTLAGVGDGTTIQYVEVYGNFDDGIEWFGGTVNGDHLMVSFVGDDMFDLDQGYTGVNQFLFGIMPFFNENDFSAGPPVRGLFGSASGDKAGEFDGDDFDSDNNDLDGNVSTRVNQAGAVFDGTPWPLSHPAMYNMTLIGSTPDTPRDFTPVSAASTNRGIQFRNGFAGFVHNSIIVNTGAETGIEVAPGTETPGFGVSQNVANDLIAVVCTTMDDGAAALSADETAALANGDALVARLGGSLPGAANAVNPNPATLLVKEDATFDPTGNAAGKLVASLKPSRINPRPLPGFGVPTGNCPNPPAPLDPAASYRGAFAPGAATPLWTNGWTALSQGGLL